MNKLFTISVCILFGMIFPLSAKTELWRLTIEDHGGAAYSVGTDGSVLIVVYEPYQVSGLENRRTAPIKKIYWLNRDGQQIAEINLTHSFRYIAYVSEVELVMTTSTADDESKLEIFQLNESGIVETSVVDGTVSGLAKVFNYPYFFSYKNTLTATEPYYTYKDDLIFYDLTSANSLKVVGDTVIGVHGSNLKVRWKTVANAKYRVQVSNDLTTWTDYTEIMDGNGSTMIVNVPLSEHNDQVYARVVKY